MSAQEPHFLTITDLKFAPFHFINQAGFMMLDS